MKPSASVCPLCGESNQCAIAAGDSAPCWCVDETFPEALVERVPSEERGRSRICRRSLEAAREPGRTGEAS